MISIYDYFDYREYLRAHYADRKKMASWFSYRYIAGKVCMDHSSVVKMYKGHRHLDETRIEKFVEICDLNKKEAAYFEILLHFNKSQSKEKGRHYFEKLLSLKPLSIYGMDKDKYEFYQKWYYSAIRSCLEYFSFSGGQYKTLANHLHPSISAEEAKEGIKLLVRLKLIEQNEEGRFILTDQHISTPAEWNSLAINAYQKETIHMSMAALDGIEKAERDISTITMAISRDKLEEVKNILESCRQKIIKTVEDMPDPNSVFQLNMQFIPLTKPKGKKEPGDD